MGGTDSSGLLRPRLLQEALLQNVSPHLPLRALPPQTAGMVTWLREWDLPLGSRIACCAPSSWQSWTLLIAAPLAGLVPVLINHRLSKDERQAIVEPMGVAAWLGAADLMPDADDLPIQVLPEEIENPKAGVAERTLSHALAAIDLHGDALIVCTSGSSGRRKGVRLSWQALLSAAGSQQRAFQLHPSSCWGCPLPWDHIGGAMVLWRALVSGCSLRWWPSFSAERVLREAGECSHLSLVATMLERLLAEEDATQPSALRGLDAILLGGGPCPQELWDRARQQGLPVAIGYGASETASAVCVGSEPSARCAGRPLPGSTVYIERPDPTGIGAIVVSSPQLFSGYAGQDGRDPENEWRSHDRGSLDAAGRLWLHGRSDRIIISGGEKVDADAVERLLAQHPSIREAAVVGCADPQWGERVVAALVASDHQPDDSATLALLRELLPDFRRPKAWLWLSELPRTALGKVDRGAVMRLFTLA